MRYGYFDDERREYVITRPDTPLPWINYLGTDMFFGIISNTAGGYCFYRDARLRRIRRPLAVEEGESFNSVAHGWAPHGSHHVRLTLAPGETKEVIFLLGYWENPPGRKFDPPGSGTLNKALVRPVIDRWLRPATVAEGKVYAEPQGICVMVEAVIGEARPAAGQ